MDVLPASPSWPNDDCDVKLYCIGSVAISSSQALSKAVMLKRTLSTIQISFITVIFGARISCIHQLGTCTAERLACHQCQEHSQPPISYNNSLQRKHPMVAWILQTTAYPRGSQMHQFPSRAGSAVYKSENIQVVVQQQLITDTIIAILLKFSFYIGCT